MAAAAWRRGDFAVAAEHGETAARIAAETGAALLDGFCHTELALFLFSAGRHDEAAVALERGRQAGQGLNHVAYLASLYGTWFSLEKGHGEDALIALREAFALAATQGYVNSPHWNPTMMAKLCAFALEHDVEPEYARVLIRRRNLVPPVDGAPSESWPWPVQIYALGRLRLKINGVTPVGASKAPRKLVELLALLVANGEVGVTVERALEVNTPSIDVSKALSLYRGPFMDEDNSEAWALAYREKLHSRYVRAVLDAGARLEMRGDFEQALACYERGLERDGLVEAFYQCVLTCCAELGRRAEGLNAYARCRERLREALDVAPSQQTEDLRVVLLAGVG
jgi:tetratricopeptide (TPR) repeat protein